MDRNKQMRLEFRARMLKALAHPTRLFIVEELSVGERCVCELTDLIGADISTVSKHLSVLRQAGIVSDEKRGSQVFYQLRCVCIEEFLVCMENMARIIARENYKLA